MMYGNKILNFQESTTILNACTKKSGNIEITTYIYLYIWTYIDITWVLVVFPKKGHNTVVYDKRNF